MTGYRLGYACGPAELIDAMMKIHQYTMLCASSLAQKAAIEALTRPEIDVGEMVDEYRRRRNFLASSFNHPLRPRVPVKTILALCFMVRPKEIYYILKMLGFAQASVFGLQSHFEGQQFNVEVSGSVWPGLSIFFYRQGTTLHNYLTVVNLSSLYPAR
jgi:hypothetical protein